MPSSVSWTIWPAPGQFVILGDSSSVTVTVNEQVALLPASSVTIYSTLVTPKTKFLLINISVLHRLKLILLLYVG